MIIDSIDNLEFYSSINPYIKDVLDFINNVNLKDSPLGVVEINGKKVFANFCEPYSKSKDDCVVETHNRMIDIQIPLSCTETMGYIPRYLLKDREYNNDNDITFYDERPEQFIDVHVGEFAIFFPQDGHAPCVAEDEKIKKVIFKLQVL